MSGEDVIVSIGVDTSGADVGLGKSAADFDAWARDAQKALDSTAKAAAKAAVETERATVRASAAAKKAADGLKKQFAALDRDHITLGAPIDLAAEKMERLRAESEKLEKVASLLGPQIGGLVQVMSKLGKTAGSDIGGATAAIAGFGAAAGVLIGYIGVIIDGVSNVEELTGALTEQQRIALAPQIAALREAKVSQDAFTNSMQQAEIVAAASGSGAYQDLIDTTTGFTNAATEASASTKMWSDTIEDWRNNPAPGMAGALSGLLVMVHDYAQGIRDARAETAKLADQTMLPFGPYAEGKSPSDPGSAIPPFLSPAAGTYADVQKFTQGQGKRSASGGSRGGGGADPLAGFTLDGSGAAFTYGSAADALAATGFVSSNMAQDAIDARKEYGVWIQNQIDLTNELTKATNILTDAEVESAEAQIKANAEAADAMKDRNRSITSTTLALVSDGVGALSQLFTNLAEAHGSSARKIWEAQHAAAVAQGALQIPLAFLQGLASGGPIAPALGAAYAALATVQEMAIIATPPPQTRHIGGIAPDETNEGAYRGLVGEFRAVFSRAAVDRLGGPSGVQQVAQTGTMRSDGGGDTYFVLDGQRLRARRFAKPTRGFGRVWRSM